MIDAWGEARLADGGGDGAQGRDARGDGSGGGGARRTRGGRTTRGGHRRATQALRETAEGADAKLQEQIDAVRARRRGGGWTRGRIERRSSHPRHTPRRRGIRGGRGGAKGLDETRDGGARRQTQAHRAGFAPGRIRRRGRRFERRGGGNRRPRVNRGRNDRPRERVTHARAFSRVLPTGVIFVRIVSRAFALAVVSRHNLARVAEPVPGRNLVWLPRATGLPSRVDTVTSMNARLLPTFKTLASISTSSKPGPGIGIARSGPRTRPGRGSRSRARRC